MSILNNSRILLLSLAAVVLVGCHDDDPPAQAALRILHGVFDAPRVNVYLNDQEVLSDVDFRAGSGYLNVKAGTYDVRVEAIVPGGNVDVITVDDFEFAANTWSTIVATGSAGQDTIAPLPIAEPTDDIAAGDLRLRVTHAAEGIVPVYLAVTTPNLPIDQAALLGPLAFGETTDAIDTPAGAYQVRVVTRPQPVNDADVVFDSGTLALADGANLHVFAVPSTVPSTAASGSPISAVVLDGDGAFDLFDVNTGANLRVVHNSTGAPGVDVFVDVLDTPADEDLEIVTNLTFANAEGYFVPAVAATGYNVRVRVSPNQQPDVLNFDADLMAGMGYTIIASDEVANIFEWVLVDDYRPVVTESKVRIVHGSTQAGTVDIYVFKSADGLLPQDVADPFLAGVMFGQETGFLSLEPDTYDIYITAAGSKIPAIPVTGLTVSPGGVYTAIARDPNPLDPMDTDLNVILIADEP